MRTTELRDLVAAAIGREWKAFEAEHPHLAGAMDQQLLVDRAVECLVNEGEYREAMEQAQMLGAAIGGLETVVGQLVRRWLRGLV